MNICCIPLSMHNPVKSPTKHTVKLYGLPAVAMFKFALLLMDLALDGLPLPTAANGTGRSWLFVPLLYQLALILMRQNMILFNLYKCALSKSFAVECFCFQESWRKIQLLTQFYSKTILLHFHSRQFTVLTAKHPNLVSYSFNPQISAFIFSTDYK